MRFARAIRTCSVPLLFLVSFLSPSQIAAQVFGETGVSNPQMTWTGGPVRCTPNNGANVIRFEWTISQTDSSNNGQLHQPMAETGLPTVKLTFNHNIKSVSNSAPTTAAFAANMLIQTMKDDGPNDVQEIVFDDGGMVTCANFQQPGVILYSMSAQAPATGTTTPMLNFPVKGTVGFSATPVQLATAAPTVPGSTPAPAAIAFGETGVTNPLMTWTGGPVSCHNNNIVRFEWVISQTDSSNNGQPHQPMAEAGLPIVMLTFNHNILSISQSAPTQSKFMNNILTQQMQDDGPNDVQELVLDGVTCANFQQPGMIMYSMTAQAPATGTTMPLLNFPVKGTNGYSATPVTLATAAPTQPGATSAPAAVAFGETGVTNPLMTWTGGAVRCSNNNVVRFEWVISQTDSSNNGQPHQPMAEAGLPVVMLTFNHKILSVMQSAPSATTFSGNLLTQQMIDDGPNDVQEIAFDGVDCTNFNQPGMIVYSMQAKAPATGTTTPLLNFPIKGTNGYSATPVQLATAPPTVPGSAPTAIKFGETGVTNPLMTWTGGAVSCHSTNVVRFEWIISQTDSSMNGQSHQPMAESGLPLVQLSFNHIITGISQSAPTQSTFNGNVLTQQMQDDGPNDVQELTFQGIDCTNFQTLIYSMSATCPATGTTASALNFPVRGTNGYSATPVTVGTTTAGTTAPTTTPTRPATTSPTTGATTAPTQATGTTVNSQNIVKFTGGFNGNGCFGSATTIFQFQVMESINGGQTFTNPMAENGLPTITVTFSNAVAFQGTIFNVANSQVSGNTWTFTLQDDQPNVGVGLTFSGNGIQCINGQFSMRPTYHISASLNGQPWGIIGTGANGFLAGNVPMAPVMMPTSVPVPPTTAINKNTFGTAMVTNVAQKITLTSGTCWMSNTGIVSAELIFQIDQTDSSSPTIPHGPMSETGLPTVTMTFNAPVTVPSTFNVGNSQASGNSWTFQELNDQPIVGGGFQFQQTATNPIACVNGQLQPFTFTISAQINGVIFPTTSKSAGFQAQAANSLNDGSGNLVTTAATPSSASSTGVSVGMIAGIIAGVVVIALIVTAIIIRSRRKSTSPSAPAKVAWHVGKDTADNKV